MSRSKIVIAVTLVLGTLMLAIIAGLVVQLTMSVPEPFYVIVSPVPVTSAPDPYAWYLEHAPAGAPHLSREDAQTRAFLGCDQTFAPGTVDAVLAEAYKVICPK